MTMLAGSSIKELVYVDQWAQLRRQLDTIRLGTHPDYLTCKEKIEQDFKDRLFDSEVAYALQLERIETEYEIALKAAQKEFNEKRAEVKDALINELEERKKQIELEYAASDLNGDCNEIKQPPKRNLRRRYNDAPETKDKKCRKSSPTVQTLLNDAEIDLDVSKISTTGNRFSSIFQTSGFSANGFPSSRGGFNFLPASFTPSINFDTTAPSVSSTVGLPLSPPPTRRLTAAAAAAAAASASTVNDVDGASSSSPRHHTTTMNGGDASSKASSSSSSEKDVINVNIVGKFPSKCFSAPSVAHQIDGKLYYKRKWFVRGESVILSSMDMPETTATIQTIGAKEIIFRNVGDTSKKTTIPIAQFQQDVFRLKKIGT